MEAALPDLNKRVMTGVAGAIAIIILVVYGGWLGMTLMTVGLSLGMIYEFTSITFSLPDKLEKRYVLLFLTWLINALNFIFPRVEYELLIFSFIFLFAYFLSTAVRYVEQEFTLHFKELMFSIFGLLYLALIPLFLLKLHESSQGVRWTLLFLFINWAGDTGAYFAGLKYGKRRLYSKISPKKTVEGALGGLLAGFVITLFSKLIFFKGLPWSGVLFIPIFVGIFAQLGDLCESFYKRAFDKKDTGSILPGHGGLLDRFDGVVFSLPIMYACTRLFA